MKLVGLLPVRNEGWILGLTLRSLLLYCDEVVVLNHASTDDSMYIMKSINNECGDRVHILEDTDPTWKEMQHRQTLLDVARDRNATHCMLVDADEMLTGNLLPVIRQAMESLIPGDTLQIPWICMWKSPLAYRCDVNVRTSGYVTVGFMDRDNLHWRPDDGYDLHHRHPYNSRITTPLGSLHDGGLMHFQFADWARVEAKHALYKINEMVRWPNRRTAEEIEAQYNPTLDETGLVRRPVPIDWIAPYQKWFHHLHLGIKPWQAVEAQRLYNEYGKGGFMGLSLFGVVRR